MSDSLQNSTSNRRFGGINRQSHVVEDMLGAAKVLAIRARILAINPACAVTTIDEFADEDNVTTLIPTCDALFNAI